jgi:hypothetical protein
MTEQYHRFLFSYRMDGSQWSFDLPAKDFEDARRRLAAIAMTGQVDGQATRDPIPAWRGWWVPAWCWLKNRGWI